MRSALECYTTRSVRADFVAALNAGVLALGATVALGSRPAPNTVQPARPHQAASRAAQVGGTARAATLGIFTSAPPALCDQAVGRPSLRRGSRSSRGSAAPLTDARLLSGEGWGDRTPRVAHACAAGVAVVKKDALPSGRATEYDVFASGGSSVGVARRGSSACARGEPRAGTCALERERGRRCDL